MDALSAAFCRSFFSSGVTVRRITFVRLLMVSTIPSNGDTKLFMSNIRGFVYRLNPSTVQDTLFRQYAGVCRLVYNLALEQRSTWGKRHGLTARTVSAELKTLRASFDWIGAVSQTAQQQALNDLDTAFQNFFVGHARYPTPRKKGVHESFRFLGREVAVRKLNRRWSEVKLPKIGWVRYRDTRPVDGEIRNATVSLTPLGWHIAIAVRLNLVEQVPFAASVGIDRGVIVPVMLSTGESFGLPTALARLDIMARRAQRTQSRRKRGSRRYAKARKRVAALKAKAARVRNDWQHKMTTDIARRFGIVVIEKLKTRNITRSAKGTIEAPGTNVRAKSGLNRVILNVGWFGIETKLAYKLTERSGHLIRVDPSYTSQTCSDCGTVDAQSRKNQADFQCVACGFRTNADLNAALNIKRRGNPASMDVETSHRPVCEASTDLAA